MLEAATGQKGLLALHHAPDGVLLDLGLPDIDGFELCRMLHARTTSPILVISAEPDPGVIARALAAGACDYLTKPFLAVDLARRVRVALGGLGIRGPA